MTDFEIVKGDKPGHPFRGNQHTRGGGGGASAETGAVPENQTPEAALNEIYEGISEAEDTIAEITNEELDELSDEDSELIDDAGELIEDAKREMDMFDPVESENRFNRPRADRALEMLGEASEKLRASDVGLMQEAGEQLKDMIESVINKPFDWEGSGNVGFLDSGRLLPSERVGKSSNMIVVQELLTVDGTVFALRKMHGGDMSMYGEMPEMEEEYDSEMEMEDYLTPRQKCQYEAFEWIAEKFGPWDKGDGANGAHYMEASANPFKKEGMICANCVFYCGGRKCEIVSGDIDPNALCKLWIIEDTNLTVSKKLSTEEQQDSVNKAISRGDFVSWDNVGGVARGRVIQIMREGTLNVPNSSFKIKAEPDDPAVLIQLYRKNNDGQYEQQDVRVGHKMSELRSIQSLEKADKFTPPASVQAAGKRAVEWIKEGLNGDGFTSVGRLRARQLANGEALTEDTVRRMANYFTRHEKDQQAEGFNQGEKGYPRPGRVAWDAWGGDAGKTWSQNLVERLNKKEVLKSVDEKRFTLAPWYVPNSLDAHLEWTDPEELQKALWTYVKSGNHDIRLQHVPDTVAGQWVEAMTWPFEVEVPMMNLENGTVQKKTFPENTVFLGVQWEPWAWELVKKGQIRGFSIGGKAGRKEEDLYVVLDKSSGETVVKGN